MTDNWDLLQLKFMTKIRIKIKMNNHKQFY